VTVQVSDLETHERAWGRLLGVASQRESERCRFQFANAALEVRRPSSGTKWAASASGLERLVFVGDAPLCLSARGVAVEVETEGARTARANPRPEGVEPVACVVALDHIVIRCSDLDASRNLYRDRLGLRLALDHRFPERRVRLVFFRVGGVTVELAGSEDPLTRRGGDDVLWGLAWRVPSIDAAHRRLSAAGLAVSKPRNGHKAGTRVFHVNDPPSAVPTLVLEDPARDDGLAPRSA